MNDMGEYEDNMKIILENKDWDIEGKLKVAYALGVCDGTIKMSREIVKTLFNNAIKKKEKR